MLELVNLSKQVTKNNINYNILTNINFNFPKSGLFFIVGESGSGKTTFLNVIAGVDKEYSGKILFNGLEIRNNTSKYILENTSITFQNGNFNCSDNIFDNCLDFLYVLGYKKKEAYAKIFKTFKQYDVDNLLFKRTCEMSGGELQRCSILKTILKDATIYLFDEPTSSIDYTNSEIFMDAIEKLSHEKLVICSCHNLDLVSHYNARIIKISSGKIIEKPTDVIAEKKICASVNKKPNLFRLFFKNIFDTSVLKSFVFLFTCILFALNMFLLNSNYSLIILENKAAESYLNYNYFTISKIANRNQTDKVTSYNLLRPKIAEIKSINLFDSAFIDISFEYIFNNFSYINNEVNTYLEILPYYSQGDNEFYINDEYFDTYKSNSFNFELKIQLYMYFNDEIFEENVEYQFDIKNAKILREFKFESLPRIYYPYLYIKKNFEGKSLNVFSGVYDKKINLYSYIENNSDDSELSSYSLIAFTKNIEDSLKIYDLADKLNEQLNVSVYSPNYEKTELFKTTLSSLIKYFLILGIISFLSNIIIFIFEKYKKYKISRSKYFLLQTYGIKTGEIFLSNIIKISIESFLYSFVSFILVNIFKEISNLFFLKYLGIFLLENNQNAFKNCIFQFSNIYLFYFFINFSFIFFVYLKSVMVKNRTEMFRYDNN